MVRRQSSGLISSTPPVGPAMPALLISASSPPREALTSSNSRATSASEGPRHSSLGMSGAIVGEEFVGDIANMDPRATRYEQIGGCAPDTGRAGRDQNAQRLRERKDVCGIVHSVAPTIRFTCRVAP
jgi:hypothetical protein